MAESTTMRTARLIVLLALWLLQAALVVLLVDAEWLKAQTSTERAALEAQLGPSTYERIAQHSAAVYQHWFVESGWISRSYEKLLPAKAHSESDLKLAPGFFNWLHKRLDAFWDIVHQAIYRIQLLRDWSFYLAWVVFAALTDGLVRRKIKRVNHRPPSGDLYTISRRAVIFLFLVPLIYLSLPLCVSPVLVPAWGCLLALSLLLLTANAQQQI